jgi:DNA-binding MarR family transcriptional regulator
VSARCGYTATPVTTRNNSPARRDSRKSAPKRDRSRVERDPPSDSSVGSPSIDYCQLPDLIGYRVQKAHSRLFQMFADMLTGLKVAPGQYSALVLIGLNSGLSQNALADACGIDRTALVPITRRFERLGWIRRSRRTEDRRVYSLELTTEGERILDCAWPLIQEHEQRLTAGLTRAEVDRARMLLARIADSENKRNG